RTVLTGQNAPGQVVFVPAGLNQDQGTARFLPRVQILPEPVPDPVAVGLGVRLLTGLDRVVHHDQVEALPGGRVAHAAGAVDAARVRLPLRGGAALGAHQPVGRGDAAAAAAEALREPLVVARDTDAGGRVALHPPYRIADRGHLALAVPGWQEQHQLAQL